jgi:hypothetical protein
VGKSNPSAKSSRQSKSSKKHSSQAARKPAGGKAKAPRYTAATADRHELYQLSVQAPDNEVEFMRKTFRSLFGKSPVSMREDFCGTAILCSSWVKSGKDRIATGVDICGDTLAWGRKHNIDPLVDAASRVTLLQEDVRAQRRGKFDVINALNFSYWIFRTREEMRNYFVAVRKSLQPEGAFFLDAYGGWESQEPMLESRPIAAGFTYVWDQDSFDPIGHEIVNHIHFEFKDGTKLERAFTYEWRYWTLPELRELLHEAGFSDVRVFWDTSPDEEQEKYRVRSRAENQPGWLAYIVAVNATPTR